MVACMRRVLRDQKQKISWGGAQIDANNERLYENSVGELLVSPPRTTSCTLSAGIIMPSNLRRRQLPLILQANEPTEALFRSLWRRSTCEVLEPRYYWPPDLNLSSICGPLEARTISISAQCLARLFRGGASAALLCYSNYAMWCSRYSRSQKDDAGNKQYYACTTMYGV